MAPKPNCETDHCNDHSGLMIWVQGGTALMALAVGLLSYSVFWQAPNIRIDIAREIARLDSRDKDNSFEIETIKKDVTDIKSRVSLLESKE